MSNQLNKASQYVQSLVDYIVDVKPYHSKLTEIVEEYQFFENMNVQITENTFKRSKLKAAWKYDFFSGGNPAFRSMMGQRVHSPNFLRVDRNDDQANNAGSFRAFRDENTDMGGVPFVFSKKQFDGLGVADAWVELAGVDKLPYVEGLDFFQSHGSMEFQIKQISDINGLNPTWVETRTDGIISDATIATTLLESNLARPQSAINRLIALFTSIRARLLANPSALVDYINALAAANNLLAVLATGVIPPPYTVAPGNPNLVLAGDYDRIIYGALAAGTPPPATFAGWVGEDAGALRYVDEALANLLSPLLFNAHSDANRRESGVLSYAAASTSSLSVFNIVPNTAANAYESWTVTCVSAIPSLWQVTGSVSGIVGGFVAGSPYTGSSLSFSTTALGTPLVGDELVLTPRNSIVIHPLAPMERWNIIKVNPLAYTRPAFSSTRYGYLRSTTLTRGAVTILNPALVPGTIVLKALSATTFSLMHTGDVTHTGTVVVGGLYNDGRVAFTIINGSLIPFAVGDFFLVEISNGPAAAVDFDLYYGYDLDSYDADGIYDFWYDSRFTDYDISLMNLVIGETAVDARQFRLMAIPTGVGVPINLDEAGVPVFSMPGDPDPAPDLTAFTPVSFRLEYSDDDGATWAFVANVNVGASYTSPALGISFSLPAGSKPFLAVTTDGGVSGGDVFFFKISNPPAQQANIPAGLSGITAPRLVMHGDSFFRSIAADWTVAFSSAVDFTVSATFNGGPLANTPAYSATLSLAGLATNAGATYKDDNVHFTVKTGRGLGAGDAFTFSTTERKPTLLVHGSVSGWTADAEYDRWYWNGRIGFMVKSPGLDVFTGSLPALITPVLGFYNFSSGNVGATYIRQDAPAVNYIFKRTTAGWMVTRSDVGVVGFTPATGTFKDIYLEMEITDPGVDFTVAIRPDTVDFWNAQDTVIVRSPITVLNPTNEDYVTVVKTEEGTFRISLDYSAAMSPPSLAPLLPIAIDTRFIDTNTGSSITLAQTSPETALLTNWLPFYLEKRDATNSIAQFPDVTDTFTARSAATGELIGVLRPQTTTLSEPTVFEFDVAFFNTFLPLNSRANLVTYGTGLDENVRVLMTERLDILVSGDAIFENALFQDTFNVNIAEVHNWTILTNQMGAMGVVAADGPFTTFLAGYDNLPYDAEDALGLDLASLAAAAGQYDTGLPLVDQFLRAQFLSTLVLPTAVEVGELALLLALISNYLQAGGIAATTLPDFLAAVEGDPAAGGGTNPTFGIPSRGMAMDVNQAPGTATTTAFSEAFAINVLETANPSDVLGFDAPELDAYGERLAFLFSSTAAPVPAAPNLTSYGALDTPLEVGGAGARIFEVSFPAPPPTEPTFSVWRLGAPAIEQVTVVQKIGDRKYRFSISNLAQVKIIVT